MKSAGRVLLVVLTVVLASCGLGSDEVEPVDIPEASDVVYLRVWQSDAEHRIADRGAIGGIVAIMASGDLVWQTADAAYPGAVARVSFRLRTDEEQFVIFVGPNWIGDPPGAVAMVDDDDMRELRRFLGLDKAAN